MKKILTLLTLSSLVILAGCSSAELPSNTNSENVEVLNENENIEVEAELIDEEKDSGEETVAEERRGHQTVVSSCFDLIQNHEFIDPNQVYYIQHIEALKPLAVEWGWGHICESADNSGYVILVEKPMTDDPRAVSAQDETELIYKDNNSTPNREYDSYYHVYFFTDRFTELTYDGVTKQFKAGELTYITDLSWPGALAGCWVQPGNFIVDGGVVIACGQGDNGCSEAAYVSWNILTGTSKYFGLCENNCDLEEGQPFTLACK